MKMKKRTLTKLLDLDRPVYLYIANRAVWDIFVKQATEEGFLWVDNEEIPKEPFDNKIALKKDMTLNYIGGCTAHMMFTSARDQIYRIDFARFINGAKDFIYNEENYESKYRRSYSAKVEGIKEQ